MDITSQTGPLQAPVISAALHSSLGSTYFKKELYAAFLSCKNKACPQWPLCDKSGNREWGQSCSFQPRSRILQGYHLQSWKTANSSENVQRGMILLGQWHVLCLVNGWVVKNPAAANEIHGRMEGFCLDKYCKSKANGTFAVGYQNKIFREIEPYVWSEKQYSYYDQKGISMFILMG